MYEGVLQYCCAQRKPTALSWVVKDAAKTWWLVFAESMMADG
jgi:hypothetical protein